MLRIHKIITNIFLILALWTACPCAFAQLTIISIPSADVLPPNKTNIKVTGIFRTTGAEFVNIIPTATRNVGYNTDVYFGVPIGRLQDTVFANFRSTVDLNIGFKKAIPISPTTQAAFGSQITPSLQNAITPVNFTYALLAQKIPQTDSRFTAGPYLRNKTDFMPDILGVLLAYEQVIIEDRIILAVDWTSRNEPWGVLAPGIIVKFNPSTVAKFGVLVPNGSQSRFAYIVGISKTF